MSDGDLERLLGEALAAEARPMSEAQVGEVVACAAVHLERPAAFPLWAVAASAAGLAALVLVALSGSPGSWWQVLAGIALAGNLGLSPLAALVLVRNRRHSHVD
jgi:hypothetical protein